MAFPDHVVADELIEAAWGNAVVDTLTLHQSSNDSGATRHYASTAALNADASAAVGTLAWTADANTLWLKEAGGWVIISEPPQVGTTTNVWRNGIVAWDQAKTPNSPITASATSFQRSMGLVYVFTDMTLGAAPGPIAPELVLPFAYTHIEGILQIDVLQPARTWFPGYCTSLGGSRIAPYVTSADTTPGGLNCILRVPLNTLTPFNWGVAGGSITVAGWYQMTTRYSN